MRGATGFILSLLRAQSLFQDGTSAPISQAGAHALLQQLQAGGQQVPDCALSQW
jgi:hypothetical protein